MQNIQKFLSLKWITRKTSKPTLRKVLYAIYINTFWNHISFTGKLGQKLESFLYFKNDIFGRFEWKITQKFT